MKPTSIFSLALCLLLYAAWAYIGALVDISIIDWRIEQHQAGQR